MKSQSTPVVSVIVPVYKVEQYIEECIDSILAQSYSNIEIILVDDGSPDNSGKICDLYAEQFPDKIKVIHKSNGGLSSARNAGLDIASGEYVTFVDSDDKILPQMYDEMSKAMLSHNVDIVASRFLSFDGQRLGSATKICEFTGTGSEVLKLCLNWQLDISANTKLYRRSTISDLRFIEGITNEDFPFISELLLKQDRVHVMQNAYYMYRQNSNGITGTFKDSFFDVFDNLEYAGNLLPPDDDALLNDFERYELQMHILSALRIVRFRKNKQYKSWLRRNRAHIRRNWKRLLTDRGLGMRWRIKAVGAFLRLP